MNVGCRHLQIRDEAKNISFPAFVLYPTDTAASSVAFGPFLLDVAADAPLGPGILPLVVISHGNGGSPMLYRTIAMHLASNGYVVAMPEHFGNNRSNNSLDGTVENLVLRPRHLHLTIDAVLAAPQFKGNVRSDSVAVVGHSFGGYSALAVAGGQPWSGLNQPVEVPADPRVKTLVLMAPSTSWFVVNESLKNVSAKILLFHATLDKWTPKWQAQLVLDSVPDQSQVDYREVEGAGHFSFISPFPPAMRTLKLLPATDPDGFDRAAFHTSLNEEIRVFLDQNI